MDTTNSNSIFDEYKKVITQFKLPGIDVNAVLESRRKDIEAIAEANTTALAGVQSLAQKQSEILRTTLTELQSLVGRVAASGVKPSANTGEVVQQALHKALADMQELASTAYRAQSDSFAVVSRRVAEHVEELKTLLQPKK
ncbi:MULTISPECIES: phasin family protein [Paraburkholderia]|uniref:phasin family protein n=1 Tax=Paraburkholderia TaxID=1822464 RepID=UPI00224F3B84|nr:MULTISPECIES: phasin family protein [Paraburkholderia]MCX4162037.1 phasin family protein [Paraburkholderia megapolitana]MDN7157534.1 phasin family protein [Paraburkholderia sp. CHISQ3]MDQ6494579.1 phasin family protein [Paraburkholderia megapolitana]